jgi:hypothetical protein
LLFLVWLTLRPRSWKQHFPPKPRWRFVGPHNGTSQMTVLDIITALRISLKYLLMFQNFAHRHIYIYIYIYIYEYIYIKRPPLWSSGQSSWLQIRRRGFDSRHYQKKSSGSGTGSTQPREYNWGATW